MDNKYMTGREIGQRLRRIRMALNMSQQDLADRVSTSPQNISKYEKDGVSNIEMIQHLSDVLGHNLLTDETDAEGTVGVIGKEILAALVEEQGMMHVTNLASRYMHGMSDERVSREIFKLERIGMCVREQYRNYYDELIDSLFLTAKGLICYKNECVTSSIMEEGLELISGVTTWEERLERDDQEGKRWYESYQEMLDSNKLERMVRGIPDSFLYRREYIFYLKRIYQSGEDSDRGINNPLILSSISFYHDILLRMVVGLSDQEIQELLDEDEGEFDTLSEELFPQDLLELRSRMAIDRMIPDLQERHTTLRTQQGQCPVLSTEEDMAEELCEDEASITDVGEMSERDKKKERFVELLDKDARISWYQDELADIYMEAALEHESPYMTDWYSKEEIEDFICNQLVKDYDKKEEIDAYLAEINRQFPQTLNYYDFPQKWEDNGLADMIRALYNIPSLSKKLNKGDTNDGE